MRQLEGKIAVVAGGSRGAGRGMAVVLGQAGATVYVAARTSRNGPKPADGISGTVEDTAEEVSARGGTGIPVVADLADERQAAALFERIAREHGRMDVLANSAYGASFMAEGSMPFWEFGPQVFREMLDTIGVCWWTSVYAARLMQQQGSGLIVHVTDNLHANPTGYRGQVSHDAGHECMNRLIYGMSLDTGTSKIAVVGLNPGFMRTERVLKSTNTDALKREFRFDLSESTEYLGRAVAALAGDPNVFQKNGQLLWVAEVAKEYGFSDIDGRLIPVFDPNAPMREFPV